MPFIVVDFQGRATAGGYLKVDGGSAMALSDDMLIRVSAGTHYLEFTSQNPAMRGIANLNSAVGNYRTAAQMEKHSVDGKISATFPENSAMLLTVVSDSSGHVLDLPSYQIQELDDEEYRKLEDSYQQRIRAREEHEKNTIGVEFLLCLLLGAIGAHKFYRGKIGMGLLYFFTLGLCGFGWGIDTIVLLIKWIKSKK